MTRTPLTLVFTVVLAAALTGCASDYHLGPVALDADDVCDGRCDDGIHPVHVAGSVHDAATGLPVGPVTVCSLVDSGQDCVTSDAFGAFDFFARTGTIAGAARPDLVVLTLSADGYVPAVHSFEAGDARGYAWNVPLMAEADFEDQADRVRVEASASRGHVMIHADDLPQHGDVGSTSAKAEDAFDTTAYLRFAGTAPTFYADEDGNLDGRLKDLQDSGDAMLLNVRAGLQTVTPWRGGGDAGCLATSGWGGARPGTFEVFVLPGHVSFTGGVCR